MALTFYVGQSATLIYLAPEAGIDPARVEKTRWAPVGQDQTKVQFTAPNAVAAIAPGQRTFRVAVTLTSLDGPTFPDETPTYEFVVTSLAAPLAPQRPVPIALDNIVTPPPAP